MGNICSYAVYRHVSYALLLEYKAAQRGLSLSDDALLLPVVTLSSRQCSAVTRTALLINILYSAIPLSSVAQ